MVRLRAGLVGAAWVAFVLIFVSAMFTAAFYLTGYVYARLGLTPPALLAQIINALLGLLFTGLTVGNVASFARSRGWMPERNLFGPILDAMQRIARGDFSVRLDNTFRANDSVSALVEGMNAMALELNTLETLRQEFISNVSHEIQSPLTSIRGFAEALENDQLSAEERHHYLGIIKNESTRLSRITDDLLKLAAFESKQFKLEAKRYPLADQLRGVALACEPQWLAKDLDLELALDEAEVLADEDLLSQVWTNLIHNAIKFTPAGGHIHIRLERQAGRVIVQVADSGLGIAQADQARIFERFYKADRSRARETPGSGLGLAIVREIVERHSGTISVTSQPGAGTTFTVSLPASL